MFSLESHCALVIIAELASSYEKCGLLLKDIASKNNIPETQLEPVSDHLISMGIIRRETGLENEDWLFLQNEPETIKVYDVVKLFDPDPFAGLFVDNGSGQLLPPSNLTTIINLERKTIVKYWNNRLKRIPIAKWCKEAQTTHFMK